MFAKTFSMLISSYFILRIFLLVYFFFFFFRFHCPIGQRPIKRRTNRTDGRNTKFWEASAKAEELWFFTFYLVISEHWGVLKKKIRRSASSHSHFFLLKIQFTPDPTSVLTTFRAGVANLSTLEQLRVSINCNFVRLQFKKFGFLWKKNQCAMRQPTRTIQK